MKKKIKWHNPPSGSAIEAWISPLHGSNKKMGDQLIEDFKIRSYLKKTLYDAGIPKIEIKRGNDKICIFLHSARPSVIIGEGCNGLKKIEAQLAIIIGRPVYLKIIKVCDVDTNAQLVAEKITKQLEKRIDFRRVMKKAISRAMRAGAKGIKILCFGCLDGMRDRTKHYQDGTIPSHTLHADIDSGYAAAITTNGRIGVKVWIYKGDALPKSQKTVSLRKKEETTKKYPSKKPKIPAKPPTIPTKPKSDIQGKDDRDNN